MNSRWREGSRLVDQLGHFKAVGDRVTFFSTDSKLHFDCLENLGSERIGRTISDNPDQLEWSVCGVLTECHGANYLLVTQRCSRPKRPARDDRRGIISFFSRFACEAMAARQKKPPGEPGG